MKNPRHTNVRTVFGQFLIALTVAFLCVGCLGQRVGSATLRDTLFSVERSNNGAYRIFVTHDDVAGYCTKDETVGEEAMRLLLEHDGEVLIHFRSLNETDSEWSLFFGSDCKTTEGSDMKVFYLESIEAVSSRN